MPRILGSQGEQPAELTRHRNQSYGMIHWDLSDEVACSKIDIADRAELLYFELRDFLIFQNFEKILNFFLYIVCKKSVKKILEVALN